MIAAHLYKVTLSEGCWQIGADTLLEKLLLESQYHIEARQALQRHNYHTAVSASTEVAEDFYHTLLHRQ